jgi:hypothetical protein
MKLQDNWQPMTEAQALTIASRSLPPTTALGLADTMMHVEADRVMKGRPRDEIRATLETFLGGGDDRTR